MLDNSKKEPEPPVFRLMINGSLVTILFSNREIPEVKNKIRDILTEAYQEHFSDNVDNILADRQLR